MNIILAITETNLVFRFLIILAIVIGVVWFYATISLGPWKHGIREGKRLCMESLGAHDPQDPRVQLQLVHGGIVFLESKLEKLQSQKDQLEKIISTAPSERWKLKMKMNLQGKASRLTERVRHYLHG